MLVPPIGPTSSPLLAIVGEAPGAEEERLGQPFVGNSGLLLNQMLLAAGIDRSSCYITNVVKERPPNNDFASLYYDDPKKRSRPNESLRAAWTHLRSELLAITPKLVVAFGGESLRALTGYTGIDNYRGTLCEANGLRVLPTLHPAHLLRGMYHKRPVVEADLRKALRQALSPSRPRTKFITDPSFEECLYYLRQSHKRIAFDLETTDNLTRLFGFAWSAEDAIAIPLMRGYGHRWTEIQEVELTLAIKELLENPSVEKLAQNAMYDNTILGRELGINVQGMYIDTMLAQHLLYPELEKDLGMLSSLYTDFPMYWSAGTGAEYNCYDCVATWITGVGQEEELHDRKMWDYFQSVRMRSARALTYIQSRGVLIDQPARSKLREQEVEHLKSAKEALALVCPANPLSPKKVMEYLYDTLKLPPQYKGSGASKRRTSDDDALQALGRKFPVHKPMLDRILEVRQTNVLISTFIDQELRDGRAVTSYNVGGTVTGRLSSSSTIDGLGGNLQNIPRGEFRRIFVADPGCVLIKADLSQAEYRVLIWKARIHRVIERWTTDPNFSIHWWNAVENIYRKPRELVTPDEYTKTKNGTFGANYGIRELKVSRMYNMPLAEARFILTRYHQAVPEIEGVYQKEIREELISTRKITNALGRERIFFGRMDDETFREAYADYCQSTVGDIIALAFIELQALGIDALLQVHDELVVQSSRADVEATVTAIRSAMERPIQFPGVDVPLIIPADIKVGPNWFDTTSLAKWKEQQCKVMTN